MSPQHEDDQRPSSSTVIPLDKPLPLQLFLDHDDAESVSVKSRLEALVTGVVAPTRAAHDFDLWVVREAKLRLEIFKTRTGQARYGLTPEEVAQGIDGISSIGPDPYSPVNDIFEGIAKLCSSFPPFHPSLDLIVEFLETLMALPERTVPTITPYWRLYDGITGELAVPDHPGWDTTKLWAFSDSGSDVAMWARDRFREEAERVYSYDYSDIETLDSPLRVRWRNFSSFAARLTVAGLADCAYICALRDIMPSSRGYRDPNTNGGRNRISADAVAGAQWIIGPEQGRWVYERCKAGTGDEDPWKMWNMHGWRRWKAQFEWIEQDEKFDARSRIVARLARDQMDACEAEDAAEGRRRQGQRLE